MKKWILFLASPLWALLSLCSCGDQEEEEYLDFVETELAVDSEGGSEIVGISSNISWNVISSASWCVLENASGNGTGSIVLKIEKNKDTSERVAKITISGGYIKKELMVKQSGGAETETETETEINNPTIVDNINVSVGKEYSFDNKANEISGTILIFEIDYSAGKRKIVINISSDSIKNRVEFTLSEGYTSYILWDGTEFEAATTYMAVEQSDKVILCLATDENDKYMFTSGTVDKKINATGKATETLFSKKSW